MKNVQVIDGADNATFSIFQATDLEFEAIFPDGQDIEFSEDLYARLGDRAGEIVGPMWDRPMLKREAIGIHGTLFYGWCNKRQQYPLTKREVDMDISSLNSAQRQLFKSRA